jgi:antibiotic biosynthesis monooxygenase (ABM) superfamily enzyme
MLMSNAASPWEGSSNRDSYLVAASNLVDELDEEHRSQFCSAALDVAAHPPLSQVDAFNASMRNPLGGMRINDLS